MVSYLGIKFKDIVRALYGKCIKILLKEKKGLSKWSDVTQLWMEKAQLTNAFPILKSPLELFQGAFPDPQGRAQGPPVCSPSSCAPLSLCSIICSSPLPPSDCDLLKTETEFSYLHTTDNCTVLEI